VYVADYGNNRIRKITAAGVVTTLAGSGSAAFADGNGTSASFNQPTGVTVDGSGNVYVADQNNHRIRKITADGVVTTLAGSGSAAFANGNGTSASFYYPTGVTVDGSGNVYVADLYNHRIRKITIGPKIVVNGTLPSATLNQTYAGFTFNSTGTNAPVAWSVSEGTLPPGMTFNATTATLSGTPTAAGTYTFILRLDSGGYSDEIEVVLNVESVVLVQGGTLPAGTGLAGQTVSTFYIGKYEVTWDEWQEVTAWAVANGYSDLANVGAGSAGSHPVHSVCWFDVVKWCNAKSQKAGLAPVYELSGAIYKTGQSVPTVNSSANGYRLPTEAEWEWAARGGVSSQGYTYSGSNDVNAVAWYDGNSLNAPVLIENGRGSWQVGQKAPNELGLFDMSGNVFEWCWDADQIQNRYLRGGGWHFYGADACRVFDRSISRSTTTSNTYSGFRLARSSSGN